jgi:prepilin-type N-terminal cleavage/methylation domain-containing protein
MKNNFSIEKSGDADRKTRIADGFTLVEIMVVVVLLSLIVLSLMAVFDSTQRAFRASITQTDMLEGGRAAIDFIATDLRAMTPSGGGNTNSANFYAAATNYPSPPSPLIQSSVVMASSRTNVLENFFILTHENMDWRGVGYAVVPSSPSGLYTLYRFQYPPPNSVRANPVSIFTNQFQNFLASPATSTNASRLMDGVVHLTVRAYDPDGLWMTNNVMVHNNFTNMNQNVFYILPTTTGEVGFKMFGATVPAAVEIEMGVVEDRTLQRAESFGGNAVAQSNWLANAAAQVHIFRERVSIPNVDPTVYQ